MIDGQAPAVRAAYYREQALLADRAVANSRNAEMAAAFREMAAEWRRLAEQAERKW